eukprot:646850_1
MSDSRVAMSNAMNNSITNAITQRLKTLYPTKITIDFNQYLKDEEYDSEVLTDDLKINEPFFVEYIISQNPSIFNDKTTKQALTSHVKKLLAASILEDDSAQNVHAIEQQKDIPLPEPQDLPIDAQPWTCTHCASANTFTDTCSTCHRKQPIDNDYEQKADEKWNCIYSELQNHYSNKKKQCNQYYRAIIDILNEKGFEVDDAADDISGFSETHNDSIIAESIMERFEWTQDDANTIQLIGCLNRALSEYLNDEKVYELLNDDDDDLNNIEPTEWKERLGIIMGLRRNAKYRSKLAKYELFATALSVFEHRELCCLLRLWIRQKMMISAGEFNEGADILKFIRFRFPEKSQAFDEVQLKKIMRIGFDHRLMGHNSIVRKLEAKYQVFVDVKRIQIWMVAIMMKMNEYYHKYKSCHSIFCMRFLPQNESENKENMVLDIHTLQDKIERAFVMLQESEKGMISEDCWVFVIDFSKLNEKNEPQIDFESLEMYDDEVMSDRKYNDAFAKNQLYHLKQLDYVNCKKYDNSTMALQVSFHKYWNKNCVSWLTNSSGHVPFFETDIVQFIPQIFKTRTEAMESDEWSQIRTHNDTIIDLKSKDRKYSEIEKCYNEFMNENKAIKSDH